jgi:hypothetical protein
VLRTNDGDDGRAAVNCSSCYKPQYCIFIIVVSPSQRSFCAGKPKTKILIHYSHSLRVTKSANLYRAQYTGVFNEHVKDRCDQRISSCNAKGMNRTLIQTRMPHAVLYARHSSFYQMTMHKGPVKKAYVHGDRKGSTHTYSFSSQMTMSNFQPTSLPVLLISTRCYTDTFQPLHTSFQYSTWQLKE